MSICVYLHECMFTVYIEVSRRPEGIRCPGTKVLVGYELPDVLETEPKSSSRAVSAPTTELPD